MCEIYSFLGRFFIYINYNRLSLILGRFFFNNPSAQGTWDKDLLAELIAVARLRLLPKTTSHQNSVQAKTVQLKI